MAGRIAIEFERNGEVVPVTQIARSKHAHETGVVLHGETSASPRGLAIDLKPLSPGTRQKFSDVQVRKDWVNPRRFELRIGAENGLLILEGVDADSLPEGRYELKVRVGGMKVKPTFPEIQVLKNGDAKLRLRETVKRRLTLNRPVEDFDGHSRRILSNDHSRLDGMPAAEWLTGAKHRDGRKAVLLNVLSKLSAIPSARPEECLARHVEHVFFAEIDRIYCQASPEFREAVAGKFKKDAGPIHGTHKRLLTRIRDSGGAGFNLESYRERVGRASLQAVIATPKVGGGPHFVDLDIDGANPGAGLVTFFIHFGEVLDPDATDHLRLFKKLDRAQVGDFLYYDVEEV